jgi:hypothetical protein
MGFNSAFKGLMWMVDVEWDLRNLGMKRRARTLDRTEWTSVRGKPKSNLKTVHTEVLVFFST